MTHRSAAPRVHVSLLSLFILPLWWSASACGGHGAAAKSVRLRLPQGNYSVPDEPEAERREEEETANEVAPEPVLLAAEVVDSGFDSNAFNDVIGIGGGAGGSFGARRGRVRPIVNFSEDSKVRYRGRTLPVVLARPPRRLSSRQSRYETWQRSRLLPNTARLEIGDKETLALEGMQFQVRIDGFRARVVVDFHFRNPSTRQLEGTFQLRLPDGASPYFLAFGESVVEAGKPIVVGDTFFTPDEVRRMGVAPERIMADRTDRWRAPKEARLVVRAKAAHAYREVVSRRVDPALMEWSGAGVFAARVFPILGGKRHRIVLGYDVDLLQVGDGLEYRLDLPRGVANCTVDLNVAETRGLRVHTEPGCVARRDRSRRFFHFSNPVGPIVVRLSGARSPVLCGEDPATGPCFATRIRPQLVSVATAASDAGIFLVDTSLSSNPEKFRVWLQVLRAILEENRSTMQRFGVLFFDIETHWWKPSFSENTERVVRELMEYCHGLALEGATNLERALREAARPRWLTKTEEAPPADLFLLSDGAATWGQRDPRRLSSLVRGGAALFAYRTGLGGTDGNVLELLTQASGGAVFSVAGQEEVAAAATAHRKRPARIRSIELRGTRDLLIAGRPGSLYPGQTLVLAGRGRPGPDARVVLDLEYGGTVTRHEVPLGQVVESDLTPRIYGQIAVAILEGLGRAARQQAAAYASHFRVTGNTCSLLMLESEEDYQRYGIRLEADTATVRKQPVAARAAQLEERLGATLESGRAAFEALLLGLEEAPGVDFTASESLRSLLAVLPERVFAVRCKPLRCASHESRALPGRVRQMLAGTALDASALEREAERRRKRYGAADALKALSSIVERRPGDVVVLRDLGFRAMVWGLGGHAFHLFRRVAQMRPYEPQTWRQMAHCLQSIGNTDLALVCFEVGMDAGWDARSGDFSRILAMDYLRLLRGIEAGQIATVMPRFAKGRFAELAKECPALQHDVVVQVAWNTDGTDVDLHVQEPTGEVCFYKNRKTKLGGGLTEDVTRGYGPEMYVLTKAEPGTYRILVDYFAEDQNRASTRSEVFVTVYRNWGRPGMSVERKTVTLERCKQRMTVAVVNVGE